MEDQSIMISKPWAPFPMPLVFKSSRSISAVAVSAKRESPVWALTTVTVTETGVSGAAEFHAHPEILFPSMLSRWPEFFEVLAKAHTVFRSIARMVIKTLMVILIFFI